MGEKLVKAFQIVKNDGGLQAQLRLALKSGMSAEKAKVESDTPENIEKLKTIAKEILGREIYI